MESIDRTRKWREKKKGSNLCPQCGRNQSIGGKRCNECSEKVKLDNKTRYDNRIKNGLCTQCGDKAEENKRRCIECRNKNNNWYKNSNYKKRQRLLDKQKRKERKKKVIEYYGGKCTCCGESELIFLCLDHINGGGNEHRRKINRQNNRCGSSSTQFYKWVEKNNYPPILQVLCYNCNAAKEISDDGTCPHQNSLKENPYLMV